MSDTKKYVKRLCGEYVEDWVSTQLAELYDESADRIAELEIIVAGNKAVAERIEELEAEIERLRALVIDMDCSCLPYASVTGEGVCQRCEALASVKGKGDE